MNKSILFCYFVHLLINLVLTFNFFPKSTDVFTINNSESYFGYSVLLQSASNKSSSRLIVGAPRANSTSQLHKNLIEPGSIYACSIAGKECVQYLLYLNENVEEKSRDRERYTNKRDNGWLGGSIDGSDYSTGSLLACAPRWVNQQLFPNYYFVQGICYYLQDSTQIEKKSEILLPLLDKGRQGYLRSNETVYYYAYGQAGISAHLTKKNKDILIGAPGILQWRGMIIKYVFNNSAMNYNVDNIPNPNFVYEIDDFAYFGYATSSGNFLNKSDEIWYVGGAPRGSHLKGKVLVYQYDTSRNNIKVHYEMSGRQHGEYFGVSLSVGDINGDGIDDIIIGGPLYSTREKYDVGCAYIYLNDGQGNFDRDIINGPVVEAARFGSAISIIGDSNHDGYSDVVIAAPYYDENKGAIFIYHGSRTGLKYSQCILGSEISNDLRGFGSSISRGIDIDNNFYNDIAVGSYLSGHAVIIKTRPIASIISSLSSSVEQISINTKSLPVSACIKYIGVHLPTNLNIKINLIADPFYNRANINQFNNNYGASWEIIKPFKHDQNMCEELNISITNSILYITQPIEIEMVYELEESENIKDTFCATCPVVDKSIPNRRSLLIQYDTGCGEDKMCQPDLNIKAFFDFNRPYIVIGRDELIQINMEITNYGEPAYALKFYSEIPLFTTFYKIPDVCQSLHNSLLFCSIGRPLYQNKTMQFTFPIDISMLKSEEKFSAFFNVTSLGLDMNLNDNNVTIEKNVKSLTHISVIGISDPEQFNLFEKNENSMKQNSLYFTHTYIVQNLGPSPLHDLKLIFLVPQRFDSYEQNIIEVHKPETSMLHCYKTSADNDFYLDKLNNSAPEAESNIYLPSKTKAKRNVAQETTSMHAALLSKMQRLTGADTAIPLNLPLNRTLSMNCAITSPVLCIEIECISEITLKRFEQISISFKLLANLTLLDKKRDKKDIIVVSSSIHPKFEKNIGNLTYTHTVLQRSLKTDSPIQWIILACVLGLIILCIVIFALYKVGFFKRHNHEKLMNEKGEFIIMDRH